MPYNTDLNTQGMRTSDARKRFESRGIDILPTLPAPEFCTCSEHSGFYWRDRKTCCADCFKVIPGPSEPKVTTILEKLDAEDATTLARLCASPAVPAIDYGADEDEYQTQVDAYHEAWKSSAAPPPKTR